MFNSAVPETKIRFPVQREFLPKQPLSQRAPTALPLVGDVVFARIFVPGMFRSVFAQNLNVPARKSGQECRYDFTTPSSASVSPPTQDGLCPLGCKVKAVQIESQQDLLPPLSRWCKLENAVSDPGQGGAGARPVETKHKSKFPPSLSPSGSFLGTYFAPLE